MSIEDSPPHNYCNECEVTFSDSFALVDHMLEEDEQFDAYYLLPSGFKLMLGSLLRFMYNNAENPEQIKLITQSTYVTLFASEMGYELVDELIEDVIVKSALQDFDRDLQELLAEEPKDDEGRE
jgi:hypothetical protein